jgi:hypothetical protein
VSNCLYLPVSASLVRHFSPPKSALIYHLSSNEPESRLVTQSTGSNLSWFLQLKEKNASGEENINFPEKMFTPAI